MLLLAWNSSGKNTGGDCHFLLQGIFPTQGLNPSLLHCGWILYHLSSREAQKKNDMGNSIGSVFSLSWVTSGKRYARPLHSKQQNIADRHEFRDIPLLWVRRLNINRITIFPRLMYRFSIIPIKVQENFFLNTCWYKFKELKLTKNLKGEKEL